MAEKSTEQIINDFFDATSTPEYKARNLKTIARPEVYAYEKELDKQIFDMDVDELRGLMLSLNKRRIVGDDSKISYTTFDFISSVFRQLWNWYIDNVRVIKNPWNDKRLRGRELTKLYADNREPFSYVNIKAIIDRIKNDYEKLAPDYAKYLECIILLFYDGFAESQEIVSFTEDMIDFGNHTVTIPRTTIHLSDRCFELLQHLHGLNTIPTLRTTVAAVSYHGGYFKPIISQSEVDSFQDRTLTYAAATIMRKLSMNIAKKYNIDFNYRMVYLTGFYDYMVRQIGKERTNEILTSFRVAEDAQELMRLAKEYGYNSDNVTYIKRQMRPYISPTIRLDR